MHKKAYVIGIGGGTCSGKSTFAQMLAARLSQKYKVMALNMDDYCKWMQLKTIAPFTGLEYVDHNHPDVVDMDKCYPSFMAAVTNQDIDIVIIEGLFALYFDKIRQQLDLKVFVDLQSDERIYRRIKRMISYETLDEIALRYLDTVRYRHDEFIEPTRWHADVVINGVFDAGVGVDIVTSHVEAQV